MGVTTIRALYGAERNAQTVKVWYFGKEVNAMFEIRDVEVTKPDDRPIDLPLAGLVVGKGFTVPPEMGARFQAIRAMVSRYNVANGVMIRCRLEADDSLTIWRDFDTSASAQGRKRQPKVVKLSTRKAEWQEWLNACPVDVDAFIPADVLAAQGIDWQTLKQWSNELYDSSHCEWSILMFDTTQVTVKKTRA